MNEIRCGQCRKKLAEGLYLKLTIKCSRCSTLNHFTEGHVPPPLRAPGASINKENLLRLEEDLSAVHLRLHQVYIEHLDWRECVKRYDRDHTLFYLDPPYWGTEGYNVEFGLEQYDQMAAILKAMKGRAVLSVNDIPAMRQAFAGLPMRELSIRYSVGGGTKPRVATGELLITNFDMP